MMKSQSLRHECGDGQCVHHGCEDQQSPGKQARCYGQYSHDGAGWHDDRRQYGQDSPSKQPTEWGGMLPICYQSAVRLNASGHFQAE